jgi:hypothetical protein
MLELELLRIGGRTAAALEDSATVFPSTGDEERLSESAMVGCVCQEHELLLGAVMVGARRNRSHLRSHSLRENEMAAKKEAQSAVEIEEKSERPTTRNWHRQVGGRRVLEGQSFEQTAHKKIPTVAQQSTPWDGTGTTFDDGARDQPRGAKTGGGGKERGRKRGRTENISQPRHTHNAVLHKRRRRAMRAM